jgi:tetratricopeptide (TPR) repeat protein
MKNIALLTTAFTFAITSLFSQMTNEQLETFVESASQKELVQKNTILMLDGFFKKSLIVADKLLELEPENANYNYRKGYALLKAVVGYKEAIPHLEIAIKKSSKLYDVFSAKEENSSVDSYYYLGRCYHLDANIPKAKENYELFQNKAPKGSELLPKTELMLKQCVIAENSLKKPVNYEMINLGETINTSAPDYSPIVSLDGQALYYTSRRLREDGSNEGIIEPKDNMYLEDIYVSYRENGKEWRTPELLDFCLPERNEATVAVSIDERSIYVYKDDEGNGDIFYSEFEDSRFKKLQPIETEGINTDAWEPHLTVSPDGRAKYFTSDREGGFGGRDIYRIIKLPIGQWSQPQNLGPTVNTEYDEDSPFISVDNKTLYFSHNGELSMGGFDVFVTVLGEEGDWSYPINLGYPLNAMGDDIYYTTTADGLTGYLSSYRGDGFGEKDIYEIKNDNLGLNTVAVVTGKIRTTTEEQIPEDVAFTITCLNCGDKYERVIYPRISDGGFFASLQPCRSYEMIFHHNNGETEFHRETFETDCDLGYEEIVKDILLDLPTMSVIDQDKEEEEEEEGEYLYSPVVLKHNFDYNNNKLDTQKGALKELLDELISQAEKGRENFEITVNASASKVPTQTFNNNMELANTRANNTTTLLKNFIENNEVLKGKVVVKTNKIGVNGPSYVYGTHENIDKYAPFQFVEIEVNGDTGDEVEQKTLNSKDAELK